MYQNIVIIWIICNFSNVKCKVDLFKETDPNVPCSEDMIKTYQGGKDYTGSSTTEIRKRDMQNCKFMCLDVEEGHRFCQKHEPNYIKYLSFKVKFQLLAFPRITWKF